LFIGFVGIFAFDVFGEGQGVLETIQGFVIHLIPALLIAGALAISWHWEGIGGLLFIGLGVYYLARTWGHMHWSAYVLIAGSELVIGLLFLVCWRLRQLAGGSGTRG
jgi:hypothetical protein